MSVLEYGPIRDVAALYAHDKVHNEAIAGFIEQAAQNIYKKEEERCLCLDCTPHQIITEAWHLYWESERKKK